MCVVYVCNVRVCNTYMCIYALLVLMIALTPGLSFVAACMRAWRVQLFASGAVHSTGGQCREKKTGLALVGISPVLQPISCWNQLRGEHAEGDSVGSM